MNWTRILGWFKRHLNWTYIIVVGILSVANMLIALWAVSTDFQFEWVLIIWCPVSILGLFGTPIWVLKQKGRSLWNMLWFLTGLGMIIVLCLKNNLEDKLSEEDIEEEAKKEKETQKALQEADEIRKRFTTYGGKG